MKPVKLIPFFGLLLVISSCSDSTPTSGTFQLLPQPVIFEITGPGSLRISDLTSCYSVDGSDLPVGSSLLEDLGLTAKESKARIVFGIDGSADLEDEGYILDNWY